MSQSRVRYLRTGANHISKESQNKQINNVRYVQEPINGDDETDVLRGESDRGQDEQHGDQASAGHAGSPDAGQSRGQTDRDDLAEGQMDVVHLGDEDSGDCLVQRCPVHVHSRPDRKDEPGHSLVDPEVLLQTPERDWQGRRTGVNKQR